MEPGHFKRLLGPPAALRLVAAMESWVFRDRDFRALREAVRDVDASNELIAFYTPWLRRVTGEESADVILQDSEASHVLLEGGKTVYLNVADRRYSTRLERLAGVHGSMWHEAGHLRHPGMGPWLWSLMDREQGRVDADRIDAAFQVLEDLRIERDLVTKMPESAPWLRLHIAYPGIVGFATTCGADARCGWAMSATMVGGRAVLGIFGEHTINSLRKAHPAFAEQMTQLTPVWEAYVRLSDADVRAGEGDMSVLALARGLPADLTPPRDHLQAGRNQPSVGG